LAVNCLGSRKSRQAEAHSHSQARPVAEQQKDLVNRLHHDAVLYPVVWEDSEAQNSGVLNNASHNPKVSWWTFH
jgi:hypothetical protein